MKVLGRLVRGHAVREFNRAVLELAGRFNPELFFVFKGTFLLPNTLKVFKKYGIQTYCFYPDNSFYAHGRLLPRTLPLYDWVFTSKAFGLRDMKEKLGVENASLLYHAYDRDLHRPVELTARDERRYGCDASFIGTWSPKKEKVLTGLVKKRPRLKLKVWGEQWAENVPKSSPLFRFIGGHEVMGEEYVRALQASAVNIAILSERRTGASADDQITSRTFHIPACGAFMVHERTDEVTFVLKEDRQMACYASVDELAAKIDYYLEHKTERQKIARAGYREVVRSHSWDHRIQVILQKHAELTKND